MINEYFITLLRPYGDKIVDFVLMSFGGNKLHDKTGWKILYYGTSRIISKRYT
ncbi:hypothetical protein IJG04_03225 [Candidatus Saccharibacteria bacterium]|nr:hypothetical protein [Candidatus Saccharibacteria bacterium]